MNLIYKHNIKKTSIFEELCFLGRITMLSGEPHSLSAPAMPSGSDRPDERHQMEASVLGAGRGGGRGVAGVLLWGPGQNSLGSALPRQISFS